MIERFVPAGPCILLDTRLTVVHVSPAAQLLLTRAAPVLTVQQRRLHAPDDSLALTSALARAVRGSRTAAALARADRPALTLRAERLTAPGVAWVLVTLRDPELETPDPALLQDLFGLTPTEALVAAGLAHGLSGAELALAMGVQPNTVQSHIKRALVKSGTRRQSQLVALILRSAAMPPHPWLVGAELAQEPGLAQTGNDFGARAGHSPHGPVDTHAQSPQACSPDRQVMPRAGLTPSPPG